MRTAQGNSVQGDLSDRDPFPPWTEWLTDKCKSITFPQLRLRAIKIIIIIINFVTKVWLNFFLIDNH